MKNSHSKTAESIQWDVGDVQSSKTQFATLIRLDSHQDAKDKNWRLWILMTS